MKLRTFEIFVPGRVCLFGEHSDWAGAYRRFNSKLQPGHVIISGTNQGLFAQVQLHPDTLIVRSTLPDGRTTHVCSLPMDREALLREAESGGFFSYAAGVAYYMLTFYRVRGIEINNYRTSLPVKKGLSSSAALCVLIARAFNQVYELKLTTRAEMEAAYQGEILTPSRCGRMDQGCAFGQIPVLMTFDGELLQTHPVRVGAHFRMLIADLKGKKDTIKILADLNHAYPFADDEAGKQVQKYLGPVNARLVSDAVAALEAGDAAALGKLMTRAQRQFDRHLMPASPAELTAPKLHQVLGDSKVRRLAYGGKGVGSQGDGCVQFVTRGEAERQALVDYLEDAYGMECFCLDIKPPQSVRKAVIPAAGLGTRLFPATKAVKKELFPVVTPDGAAKPLIVTIVEEAVRSGIEELAIIVRAEDRLSFEQLFKELPEYYERLPDKAKGVCHYLQDLGERLTFLVQESQEGFGHAVFCARDWVGNEPFLLLLGDHLYASTSDRPCAQQLIDTFSGNGRKSVVGLYEAAAAEVTHYGTAAGEWLDDGHRRVAITSFAEKPSLDYAREHLTTPDLKPDHFLCVYGQYVLTAGVFELLARQIETDERQAGEIQLTTALEALRQAEGIEGCVVAGRHYDVGNPKAYLESMVDFALAGAGEERPRQRQ